MLRWLFLPLTLIVSVGALWSVSYSGNFDFSRSVVGVWLRHHYGASNPEVLEQTALQALGTARRAEGQNYLKEDSALQHWLREGLPRGTGRMDEVLRQAKLAFPSYAKFAIISTQSLTLDGLEKDMAQWKEGLDPTHTNVAAVAQMDESLQSTGCTILVGEKLPTFSPEALDKNLHGLYFSTCPHCGSGHSCTIGKITQCVSLQCPDCHRVYAMLAVDTHGRLRYVNEYLKHYQPPAHFPKNIPPLAEMLLIWKEVGRTCRYQVDALNLDPTAGDDPTDSWQTAQETQRFQTGDCKDSSVLLADWLLSRSFQVRVAVGRYAERGGHAWVVSKVSNREYLLESTQPHPDVTRLPLVTEVGSRYIPELLFDYDAIYVRQHPDEPFDGDYWSTEKWIRVVPRPREGSDSKPNAVVKRPRSYGTWSPHSDIASQP